MAGIIEIVMKTKFVIVGTQRSGTTFIRHCLISHEDVNCHGELFLNKYPFNGAYRIYRNRNIARKLRHYLARAGLVREYLDEIYRSCEGDAVGFKLMYSQIRTLPYAYPSVLNYIDDNKIKVVHVIRKNVLKTHVSRCTAMQRKLYHAKEKVDVSKITLNTRDVLKALNRISRENEWWQLRYSGGDYYSVCYEDFVRNKEEESAGLLRFLNVADDQVLTSKIVKINPDRLQDIVENYDDLYKVITGSKFEYCLEM
jgi:LPS sulfotransferase NodH